MARKTKMKQRPNHPVDHDDDDSRLATRGSPLSRREIRDRALLTDAIADVMHAEYRDMTIDTLLTWPRRAQAMAAAVLRKMHWPISEDNEHEVCRAALAARKRGDFPRAAA